MTDETKKPEPAPVQPRQASAEELVVHSHANIIAGHAQALQQAVQGGAPASLVQLHVDSICSHATKLKAATTALAAKPAVHAPLPAAPVAPASTSTPLKTGAIAVLVVVAVSLGLALARAHGVL